MFLCLVFSWVSSEFPFFEFKAFSPQNTGIPVYSNAEPKTMENNRFGESAQKFGVYRCAKLSCRFRHLLSFRIRVFPKIFSDRESRFARREMRTSRSIESVCEFAVCSVSAGASAAASGASRSFSATRVDGVPVGRPSLSFQTRFPLLSSSLCFSNLLNPFTIN